MSIKDTIKSLEEADTKLEKAVGLEKEAVEMHKKAALLREEGQRDLEKANIEKSNLIQMRTAWDADFRSKEQELKNREVTLTAKQAQLDHKTLETNKTFVTSHAVLDARGVATDKAERRNKEFGETLDKRAEQYRSIGEFINKSL